ncbi:hypothetical protein GE300_18290 [Rhodobacteraceae bacterium 2CG4]|uniref:Glycosyl transferase family 2 n=1 Tax=Halovulum marinum TaxID=2662447 RepID=A0A6L5Z6C0_9RHOB|nr:hypothetical protein [Halovulum marinum]MSU91532.1 hypothetical protein [Halovulum marinum]
MHSDTAGIIANMTTFPARLDLLNAVLDAVAPQVGRLNLVLNEFKEVPTFLRAHPNVAPLIPPRDLKDTGKFFADTGGAEAVFLLDDDILYPPDYVASTLARMTARDTLYTYHGAILRPAPHALNPLQLKRTIRRLRKGFDDPHRFRSKDRFWERQARDRLVNLPGSGVSMLRPEILPPFGFMDGSAGFVDIRLARWCAERGLPIRSLARPAGWIRRLEAPGALFATVTKQRPKPFSDELDHLMSVL